MTISSSHFRITFTSVILFIVSLLNSQAAAQLYNPEITHQPEFQLSKAQKGVKLSTDICVIAMPVATIAGVLIMQDWEGLKEGAFTAAATLGTTYLLKTIVKEQRPDFSTFDSFPSGHTSSTFACATFLQLRYGWKVGLPAYILSTYVGWGRVFAKRHHVWDVVAGAAIGAGCAMIFTHPWAKQHNLRIAPIATTDPYTLTTTLGVTTTFNL